MELFQIMVVRTYYDRAIEVLDKTRALFDMVPIVNDDLHRMVQIMRQYRANQFDYADVAIMAVAERLDIRRICTFDRRDFSVFRPRHCSYLELLPE
jgi:hypothetical protein